jgi:hypothetical protein
MEQALKLIVRNRKNAYFYKTPAGAAISDVITSLIATAMQALMCLIILMRYSDIAS